MFQQREFRYLQKVVVIYIFIVRPVCRDGPCKVGLVVQIDSKVIPKITPPIPVNWLRFKRSFRNISAKKTVIIVKAPLTVATIEAYSLSTPKL